MPRQIQRDDPPPFSQSGLGEHPGVEIGAKPVQQQDRDTVAFAEREIAQPQAGGLQFTRARGFGVGRRCGGRLGGRKAGDKIVDVAVRNRLGSGHGEQGADR